MPARHKSNAERKRGEAMSVYFPYSDLWVYQSLMQLHAEGKIETISTFMVESVKTCLQSAYTGEKK